MDNDLYCPWEELSSLALAFPSLLTAPGGGYDSSAFELELSGQHQEQYSRQFSSSPESEATDRDQQYAELVSSPDVSNQEVRR